MAVPGLESNYKVSMTRRVLGLAIDNSQYGVPFAFLPLDATSHCEFTLVACICQGQQTFCSPSCLNFHFADTKCC